MNMLSLGAGFALSVAAYLMGAFASLACWRKPALARRICCSAALAAAALGGLTSVLGILRGTPVGWSVPSGVPLFVLTFLCLERRTVIFSCAQSMSSRHRRQTSP